MSTLRVTNIQVTGETASRSATGVASAWLNFDGTGTAAINDSINIAALNDTGTGDYRPTFTNNYSANNYAVVCMGQHVSTNAGCDAFHSQADGSTTKFRFSNVENNTDADTNNGAASIHGALA